MLRPQRALYMTNLVRTYANHGIQNGHRWTAGDLVWDTVSRQPCVLVHIYARHDPACTVMTMGDVGSTRPRLQARKFRELQPLLHHGYRTPLDAHCFNIPNIIMDHANAINVKYAGKAGRPFLNEAAESFFPISNDLVRRLPRNKICTWVAVGMIAPFDIKAADLIASMPSAVQHGVEVSEHGHF